MKKKTVKYFLLLILILLIGLTPLMGLAKGDLHVSGNAKGEQDKKVSNIQSSKPKETQEVAPEQRVVLKYKQVDQEAIIAGIQKYYDTHSMPKIFWDNVKDIYRMFFDKEDVGLEVRKYVEEMKKNPKEKQRYYEKAKNNPDFPQSLKSIFVEPVERERQEKSIKYYAGEKKKDPQLYSDLISTAIAKTHSQEIYPIKGGGALPPAYWAQFYKLTTNGKVSIKTNEMMKKNNIYYVATYTPTELADKLSTYYQTDVSKNPILIVDFYNKYLKGKNVKQWKSIIDQKIKEKEENMVNREISEAVRKYGGQIKYTGDSLLVANALIYNKEGAKIGIGGTGAKLNLNKVNKSSPYRILKIKNHKLTPIEASEIDIGQVSNNPNSKQYLRLDDIQLKSNRYYVIDKIYYIFETQYKGTRAGWTGNFSLAPNYLDEIYNKAKQLGFSKYYDMLKKLKLVSTHNGVPEIKNVGASSEIVSYVQRAKQEVQEMYQNKNPISQDIRSHTDSSRLQVFEQDFINGNMQKNLGKYVLLNKKGFGKNFIENQFWAYGVFYNNTIRKGYNSVGEVGAYNLYIVVIAKTFDVQQQSQYWVEYKKDTSKPIYSIEKDEKGNIIKTKIVDYEEIPEIHQEAYNPELQTAELYRDSKGRPYYRIRNLTDNEIINNHNFNAQINNSKPAVIMFMQFAGEPGSGQCLHKPFVTSVE